MGQAPQTPGEAGHDPSMEDILASIRRILSDDETQTPTTPTTPAAPTIPAHVVPAAVPSAPPDDVLILHEDMMVPDPIPAETAPAPTEPVALAVAPPSAPLQAEPPAAALLAPPQLVGDAAKAAAAGSVDTLVRKLAQERATAVHRGGPTIEDLVRDEMRPLLKEWLDLHLPPMVERLVRVELERVVGRAVP